MYIKYFSFIVLMSALSIFSSCSGGSNSGGSSPEEQTFDMDSTPPNVATPTEIDDEPSFVDPSIIPPAPYTYKGRQELNQSITSGFTQATYIYHVYLPPEYDSEPNRIFPVIYFTDAEWYTEFQNRVIDFESRPVITVGIQHMGRRGPDYTWPGVQNYHRFLVEELIPSVESTYRVSAENRTLKGDSGGGSQTLNSMILDDPSRPTFKYHLAFDPYIAGVYSQGVQQFIDTQRPTTASKILVITSMRQGLHPTVEPFVNRLKSSNISRFTMHDATYNLEHSAATWSSFSNALKVIYDQ